MELSMISAIVLVPLIMLLSGLQTVTKGSCTHTEGKSQQTGQNIADGIVFVKNAGHHARIGIIRSEKTSHDPGHHNTHTCRYGKTGGNSRQAYIAVHTLPFSLFQFIHTPFNVGDTLISSSDR
ncbi:MAG TPA: hypothetical protein VIM13_01185 [Clostridia bacterium]